MEFFLTWWSANGGNAFGLTLAVIAVLIGFCFCISEFFVGIARVFETVKRPSGFISRPVATRPAPPVREVLHVRKSVGSEPDPAA